MKIAVFPPPKDIIETNFKMVTINYEYVRGSDPEDPEIEDVEREFQCTLQVPVIDFVDWVIMLSNFANWGILSEHLYSKSFEPYKPVDSSVWDYFEEVKGNRLSNYRAAMEEDKVRIYVFMIEGFNYFAILRLRSHFDWIRDGHCEINEKEGVHFIEFESK